MEKEIARKYALPYYETAVVKLDRKRLLSNLKIPVKLALGVSQATEIIRFLKPDVVFSKGGYVALPTCFAAKKLGIPVVCHESDFSLGLANKIVSKFAVKTLTSFPETKGGIFVGNPVREDFFKRERAQKIAFFPQNKSTLLVCGGSLGAVPVNNAVYQALPTLLKDYNVVHVAGKNANFSVKLPGYFQCAYTDDFPSYLASCDVVVCRSGANTLTEAAALGKRCVTVPLPKGSSRGDQILNAHSFERRGYCTVLPQQNLSPDTLVSAIEAVRYKVPLKLDASGVNTRVVQEILSVLPAHP